MSQKSVTFEPLKTEFFPEWGFRPNTPMYPMNMNFIFLNGGMGDYLCWMRPIQWMMECAPWLRGTLIHPTYLTEIVEYFMKDHKTWSHSDYKRLAEIQGDNQVPYRGPVVLQNESLNATGAHLFTCGWVYFTNKECAPEGKDSKGLEWKYYPKFGEDFLTGVELPSEVPEPGTYAVITTGITTPSRHIKPEYLNMIIEYVHSLGLKPVFLGKSMVETGNRTNIHTDFNKSVRYDLGVNLVNKTTLRQAASIISKSKVIIGHDNGLLHLAGLTETPIVFGYNLASPKHRRPLRPTGQVYDVVLPEGALNCYLCQSKTNLNIGYNFRQCFYNDLKCFDLLFADNAKLWRDQIDLALNPSGHI